MDDYLHRRAALLPAYSTRASHLLQHQPYRLRPSQPWTDIPYYGLDRRRQVVGGDISVHAFHALPHAGLVPFRLGGVQQHAPLVSGTLDLSLATRDRYVSLEGRNSVSRSELQPKRTRTADIREDSRKKPKTLQGVTKDSDKEGQNERLEEVIMLHNLWKSGKKGPASKGESKEKKLRQKNKNKSKRSNRKDDGVKNDSSDKLANQSEQVPTSAWKGFSSTDLDQNNGTWEQQSKEESEPQKVGWSMASQPETEKGNSLNAVTVKPDIEKEKMHGLLGVQDAALEFVKEFLGNESDIDDESDEELDEEMEEVEADQKFEAVVESPQRIKGREEKAFDFFVRLFNQNQELRKAYEECCNCGTFECLVCAAAGRNLTKRFSDLVGLVQHARKVLNTKRRPEHRGYGRAVCGLLGWDPSRDPVLPRTVIIHPRGCIPPPDEEHRDNDVTRAETTKVMDGKVEAKAEGKNVTDKNNTIETTVMNEGGKDSKDAGANGGEGLDIEKTNDIEYDDHNKHATMAHDSSLTTVSSC